jgi:hypothetical protein
MAYSADEAGMTEGLNIIIAILQSNPYNFFSFQFPLCSPIGGAKPLKNGTVLFPVTQFSLKQGYNIIISNKCRQI